MRIRQAGRFLTDIESKAVEQGYPDTDVTFTYENANPVYGRQADDSTRLYSGQAQKQDLQDSEDLFKKTIPHYCRGDESEVDPET